ncbi:HD-GYP domain-containing protein [Salinispira pacifica]|nr:HD-GYP domain-containing protein [Salinispira pacifica]
MKFTEPLYMDADNIIVPGKVPLKEKDIQRLKRWKINVVQTEGEIISEEEDEPKGFQGMIQMAFTSPSQKEVTKYYSRYTQKYAEFMNDIEARTPPDSIDIKDLIDKIMELLHEHKEDVIQYILYGKQGESNSAENAVNATILSILIGQEMNLVSHKIHQLAASALLRDCGMLRIPDEIRNKKGKLSSDELQQIRTHPVHSYRIITKEIGFSEDVGIPAMQHQERWDGHGYPKNLKGNAISLHARIISVADAFEAMVSERPHRNAMIGYTAMRTILSDNGRRFDPDILKIFIRTLGIYPIGSIVLLNNSCIGRVVKHKPDAPLRPRIKVMIDEEGTTHFQDDGEIIDLAESTKIFIAKAVDPKTVQEKS